MRARSAFRGAIAAFAALNLVSCGDDSTSPPPTPEQPAFPADYLTSFTEVRNLRASSGHDGSNINTQAIRVHCTPSSADEYANAIYPLPAGTTLVKTQYADPAGTVVIGYTVMVKQPAGTAATLGDWFWQDVASDRTVLTTPQNECFECHSTNGDCSVDLTCTLP